MGQDGGRTYVNHFFEATDLTRERYLHTDHLGSITAISDETGQVVTWMGFDPWGQRRNADAWHPWTAPPAAYLQTMLSITPQGFTGHEHVDTMGIIHMGGRIYDPVLGRFLQADPFVEDITTLNRFTYVHNNPLAFTDPSGFFGIRDIARIGAVVAIGVFVPPALVNLGLPKFAAVMFAGGLAGAVSTGTIQGALIGAFTAGAFHGIGAGFEQLAENYQWAQGNVLGTRFSAPALTARSISNGIAGGTLNSLQGGRFGHGFVSAGVTDGASPAISSNISDPFARGFVNGILGGTVSSISGGKFANGALTAGLAYAATSFNDAVDAVWDPPPPLKADDVGRVRVGVRCDAACISAAIRADAIQPLFVFESALLPFRVAGAARTAASTRSFSGSIPRNRALVPFNPPNDGFIGASRRITLPPGTRIDRRGFDGGRFLSPAGTPDSMRALRPGTETRPLRTFEVTRSLEVRAGQIAPAHGQPGLGTQFVTDRPVRDLLREGVLRNIDP